MTSVHPCGHCGKPSKMQCPTCRKLGIPPSFFCSKVCFKDAWGAHKNIHKMMKQMKAKAKSSERHSSLDRFIGYRYTGSLRAGEVSEQMTIPSHIAKPDYHATGIPVGEEALGRSTHVHVHTPKEIEVMRRVCRLGREVLDIAGSMIKPGVTTDDIDKVVFQACVDRECYPSPLNYRGFPKSVCTSVNEVICHAIPDNRPLEEGDILNLDITVFKEGMHADLNETFFVGQCDKKSEHLVETAYACLAAAIEKVRPGVLYRDMGDVISKIASKRNCSVVKSYCGHGIGELFHTTPSIPHYKRNKAIGVMKVGHIFTIEPMINTGGWQDETWPDNWTAVTRDGSRSAQFEHTLVVTETGCEILTRRLDSPIDKMVWSKSALQRP